jgi:hypothetical protein
MRFSRHLAVPLATLSQTVESQFKPIQAPYFISIGFSQGRRQALLPAGSGDGQHWLTSTQTRGGVQIVLALHCVKPVQND